MREPDQTGSRFLKGEEYELLRTLVRQFETQTKAVSG